MDVQNPPWASELLANRKVKIATRFWSTSLDSSSNVIDGDVGDVFVLNNTSGGVQEGEEKPTMIGMTTNIKKKIVREGVVEPVVPSSSSPSASAACIRTEKSAPIRRDESAKDAANREEEDMKAYIENGEETSILEYGPGIVRKLRSRYQSLALRQSCGRPSLRRSTSLENCLDAVSSETLSSTSPSPMPYYEDEIDGDNSCGRSRRILVRQSGVDHRGENMTVNNNNNANNIISNRTHGVLLAINNNNKNAVNRGRPVNLEYNRKDRMKRARSVDALHRSMSRHDEILLEKFQSVVSPKEEIVIIEVSKPRANISYESSNIHNYNNIIDERFNSQQYCRSSSSSSALNANHNCYSGNSSELNRSRSVTSPVDYDELPRPDIVRETARIFEKNHDNQQNPTSHNGSNTIASTTTTTTTPSNNVVINNFKKVGHALRVTKSSSVSPTSSSPLPSPTSNINNNNSNTNSTMNTPIMNGQGGISSSYHQQQQKNKVNHLTTTQGPNISTQPTVHQKNYIVNGVPTSSSSSIISSSSKNSVNNTKQIGVIKPTITNTSSSGKGLAPKVPNGEKSVVSGNKINNSSSSSTGSKNNNHSKVSATIDVSPILLPSCSTGGSVPSSNFSHFKPPISPKPLFTSSPKNIFSVSNKTGKMTESSNPNISNSNSGNAKSPEEPYEVNNVNLSFDSNNESNSVVGGNTNNNNRVKSPTMTLQTRGLNENSSSTVINKKHIPTEKQQSENENNQEVMMEFQQVSLKPVGLGKLSELHSEVITTNNNNNNNSNQSNQSERSNNFNTKNASIPNQVLSNNTGKGSNNSSSNKITTAKTNNIELKTEQKDEKSNAKGNSKQPSSSSSSSLIQNSNNNNNNTVVIKPKAKTENNNEESISNKSKETVDQKEQSQLRTHQKQKMAQQSNHASGTMVFNFTNRQKVPDYIEDDGLHLNSSQRNISIQGTVTDESQDDDTDIHLSDDHIDSRLINFEGANIIINGKSSIQKKPKSQKLNISFNEDIIATFEYPSEASVLDDTDSKDTLLGGHKAPNILNTSGTGLGSYTPSKMGPSYQLGNFNNRTTETKKSVEPNKKTQQEDNNENIEDDYFLQFKPDTQKTTWSNEIGADILF